jgi:hypothetical protein
MTEPKSLSKWVSFFELMDCPYQLKDFEILQHIKDGKLTPYSAFEMVIGCPPEYHESTASFRARQRDGLEKLKELIAHCGPEGVMIPHGVYLTSELFGNAPGKFKRDCYISKQLATEYAEALEADIKTGIELFGELGKPGSWTGLLLEEVKEYRAWSLTSGGKGITGFIDEYLKDAMFLREEVEKLYQDEEFTTTKAQDQNSLTDKQKVRTYAKGVIDGIFGKGESITRSAMAEKIQQAFPDMKYELRTYITWTQNLFPDYTPLTPGAKKKKK